jgi:hypothetical protein
MSNLPLSLIANRANVARVTGLKPQHVKEIQVKGDRASVLIKRPRQEPELITLKLELLEAAFHVFRKEGGRSLVVLASQQQPDGRVLHLVEGTLATNYYVEENHSRLTCTCEDFQTHETLCKHGWAVLWMLGIAEHPQPLAELVHLRQRERDIHSAAVAPRPRAKQVRGLSID